ncbi:phosphatase PAP2 family protein [Candidatus Nitrospira bockiana]
MTWDLELFRTINGWSGRVPLADAAMVALGHGSNLVLPGILVFAYWWWRARREAVIGAAALAALVAVADVLGAQVKHLVARPRPCRILDGVRELVGCGGTYSFPSNHAMNTAAAAAFAQVLYPATGWVSWPLVVLIGLSRV